MSDSDVKHFLVVYDITAARADVRPFGRDYESGAGGL